MRAGAGTACATGAPSASFAPEASAMATGASAACAGRLPAEGFAVAARAGSASPSSTAAAAGRAEKMRAARRGNGPWHSVGRGRGSRLQAAFRVCCG